jgi:hypothetical protein
MMNEEQKKYTIESIKKYRKEENKADRKGFWQLMVANASVVLIGVDAYLSSAKVGVIPKDIALLAGTILGVAGLSFFGESIRNNSRSNTISSAADLLENQLDIDEKEEPIVCRHAKTR